MLCTFDLDGQRALVTEVATTSLGKLYQNGTTARIKVLPIEIVLEVVIVWTWHGIERLGCFIIGAYIGVSIFFFFLNIMNLEENTATGVT